MRTTFLFAQFQSDNDPKNQRRLKPFHITNCDRIFSVLYPNPNGFCRRICLCIKQSIELFGMLFFSSVLFDWTVPNSAVDWDEAVGIRIFYHLTNACQNRSSQNKRTSDILGRRSKVNCKQCAGGHVVVFSYGRNKANNRNDPKRTNNKIHQKKTKIWNGRMNEECKARKKNVNHLHTISRYAKMINSNVKKGNSALNQE